MATNIELLEIAAIRLQTLLAEVVFVGGAVLDLLITDETEGGHRSTFDVDVIAEIATQADMIVFAGRLRAIGFSEDTRENAPICRWRHGDLTLDVMPIDPALLGFTNRWYRGALSASEKALLPSGAVIRSISAPFFLGTKLEAFRNRGRSDYFSSHDFEDFIAVVDGRATLVDELIGAPSDLRAYMVSQVSIFLADAKFHEALPGNLRPDYASQARSSLVLGRLRAMVDSA